MPLNRLEWKKNGLEINMNNFIISLKNFNPQQNLKILVFLEKNSTACFWKCVLQQKY